MTNRNTEPKRTFSPDFTHCEGRGCGLRYDCLRHDAHIAFTKQKNPFVPGAYYLTNIKSKGKKCQSFVTNKSR